MFVIVALHPAPPFVGWRFPLMSTETSVYFGTGASGEALAAWAAMSTVEALTPSRCMWEILSRGVRGVPCPGGIGDRSALDEASYGVSRRDTFNWPCRGVEAGLTGRQHP